MFMIRHNRRIYQKKCIGTYTNKIKGKMQGYKSFGKPKEFFFPFLTSICTIYVLEYNSSNMEGSLNRHDFDSSNKGRIKIKQ